MLLCIDPQHEDEQARALIHILNGFLGGRPTEIGLVDISTTEVMKVEYETGIKLHSTAGLIFSVVPILHRVCFMINSSWFVPSLIENFMLHIEYLPRYMGTINQFQGWTLPIAMKLLYGYFNDLQQMNNQFGHHYCDGHSGNILFNVSHNKVQFYWADPGQTSQSRHKVHYDTEMNAQFLSSIDNFFELMWNFWNHLPDAMSVVGAVHSHHLELLGHKDMNSRWYLDSMVPKIQSEIEKELSRKDWDAFMSLLHPSSRFSESVSSKRIRVLEDDNNSQNHQIERLNDDNQILNDNNKNLNDDNDRQNHQIELLNRQIAGLFLIIQNMTGQVVVFPT